MSLQPGNRLGPYEILAPVGAGGMGEVYRAKDLRLGRAVAVKVLPEQLADDQKALLRFEREAQAVAALTHPSILTLHDVGSHNGAPTSSPSCSKARTFATGSTAVRSASPKASRSPWASPRVWPRRTARASPIAISSPRTSSSPATVR
ncbi:MAG: hypothetical protein HC888_18185 [Candidatus Competibacteraceae bacterium]|nr:hypothetical protein [Candidatus Competibacteraceae bacterium]